MSIENAVKSMRQEADACFERARELAQVMAQAVTPEDLFDNQEAYAYEIARAKAFMDAAYLLETQK